VYIKNIYQLRFLVPYQYVYTCPAPPPPTTSPNKILHVIPSQPDAFEVFGVGFDAGEDVGVAGGGAVGVAVDQRAGVVEEGDAFLDVGDGDEGVDVAWRLEDVGAFRADPVVLQIAPAAFDDEAVHGRGVAVQGDDLLAAALGAKLGKMHSSAVRGLQRSPAL